MRRGWGDLRQSGGGQSGAGGREPRNTRRTRKEGRVQGWQAGGGARHWRSRWHRSGKGQRAVFPERERAALGQEPLGSPTPTEWVAGQIDCPRALRGGRCVARSLPGRLRGHMDPPRSVNVDTGEKPERPWWRRNRTAAVLVWLLIAYPLSVGPAGYARGRGWLPRIPCVVFFAPLWAAVSDTPSESVLSGYYVRWMMAGSSHRDAASDLFSN